MSYDRSSSPTAASRAASAPQPPPYDTYHTFSILAQTSFLSAPWHHHVQDEDGVQVSNEYIYCKHEVGLPHILIGLVTIAIYVVFIAFERSRGAPVRFLAEIVDDFRRFVDEIWRF